MSREKYPNIKTILLHLLISRLPYPKEVIPDASYKTKHLKEAKSKSDQPSTGQGVAGKKQLSLATQFDRFPRKFLAAHKPMNIHNGERRRREDKSFHLRKSRAPERPPASIKYD